MTGTSQPSVSRLWGQSFLAPSAKGLKRQQAGTLSSRAALPTLPPRAACLSGRDFSEEWSGDRNWKTEVTECFLVSQHTSNPSTGEIKIGVKTPANYSWKPQNHRRAGAPLPATHTTGSKVVLDGRQPAVLQPERCPAWGGVRATSIQLGFLPCLGCPTGSLSQEG